MKEQFFKLKFTAEAETLQECLSHFRIAQQHLEMLAKRDVIPETNGRGETQNGSYYYSLTDLVKRCEDNRKIIDKLMKG